MIGLVYLSEATVNFDLQSLEDLAVLSASKNRLNNISGYLSLQRNRFVQYIEGSEENINALMKAIEKDNRHKVLFKISREIVDNRVFPNWSMRLIAEDELNKFQLELFIEQNLLYIKNNFGHKDRCEEMLWNHVKTISQIRKIRTERINKRSL